MFDFSFIATTSPIVDQDGATCSTISPMLEPTFDAATNNGWCISQATAVEKNKHNHSIVIKP